MVTHLMDIIDKSRKNGYSLLLLFQYCRNMKTNTNKSFILSTQTALSTLPVVKDYRQVFIKGNEYRHFFVPKEKNCKSVLSDVFMTWRLVKQKDYFTLHSIYLKTP